MQIKLDKNGLVVGGGYAAPETVLYEIAKRLFGADANGIVTIPATLTAAPTSFANTTFVAEIKSKT